VIIFTHSGKVGIDETAFSAAACSFSFAAFASVASLESMTLVPQDLLEITGARHARGPERRHQKHPEPAPLHDRLPAYHLSSCRLTESPRYTMIESVIRSSGNGRAIS
jgi:hypothetical protein